MSSIEYILTICAVVLIVAIIPILGMKIRIFFLKILISYYKKRTITLRNRRLNNYGNSSNSVNTINDTYRDFYTKLEKTKTIEDSNRILKEIEKENMNNNYNESENLRLKSLLEEANKEIDNLKQQISLINMTFNKEEKISEELKEQNQKKNKKIKDDNIDSLKRQVITLSVDLKKSKEEIEKKDKKIKELEEKIKELKQDGLIIKNAYVKLRNTFEEQKNKKLKESNIIKYDLSYDKKICAVKMCRGRDNSDQFEKISEGEKERVILVKRGSEYFLTIRDDLSIEDPNNGANLYPYFDKKWSEDKYKSYQLVKLAKVTFNGKKGKLISKGLLKW